MGPWRAEHVCIGLVRETHVVDEFAFAPQKTRIFQPRDGLANAKLTQVFPPPYGRAGAVYGPAHTASTGVYSLAMSRIAGLASEGTRSNCFRDPLDEGYESYRKQPIGGVPLLASANPDDVLVCAALADRDDHYAADR